MDRILIFKKVFILFVIFSSFLSAEVFWNDIYKLESKKIKENTYQINIMNKGDFTENDLFIDKKNNDILKNENCQYLTNRYYNSGIFTFEGDGSIKCDNEYISFISKYNKIGSPSPYYTLFYDMLYMAFLIFPVIFLAGFFIIYLMTKKKLFLVLTIIFALLIPITVMNQSFIINKLCNIQKKYIYKIKQNEKKLNIIIYKDPTLFYLKKCE